MIRVCSNISIVLLFLFFAQPLECKDKVAVNAGISEPLYFVFSTDEYPLLALSNTALYKVFGEEIVQIDLPIHLNLDLQQKACVLAPYKQLWIPNKETGVTVIDYSDRQECKISQTLQEHQIKQLYYDQYKSILAVNDSSFITKVVDSDSIQLVKHSNLISSGHGMEKDAILLADFKEGILLNGAELQTQLKGITALTSKDNNLWALAQGNITLIPNGTNPKKLKSLPDKYIGSNTIFVDDNNIVWVQGEQIFWFDHFEKSFGKLDMNDQVTIHDACHFDGNLAIATNKGLYYYQPTVDELVFTKQSAGIPKLYGDNTKAFLIDESDLFQSDRKGKFKKLSVNTRLRRPIKGSNGWWVLLGKKILKVGDRSIPPIPDPNIETQCIYETADGSLLFGGNGVLRYRLNGNGNFETLNANINVDHIVDFDNRLLVFGDGKTYVVEQSELQIDSSLIIDYLPNTPPIREGGHLIVCSRDSLAILGPQQSRMTIHALEDLNLEYIIDVELVNEKLYVLSPRQLTTLNVGDLIHGAYHIADKYPVNTFEDAQLHFVGNQLLIETERQVSYVNPSKFVNYRFPSQSNPGYTIENGESGIFVFDKSGSKLPSQWRYKDRKGEWKRLVDNQISYKELKRLDEGLILQKLDNYGEWVPNMPKPVFISSPQTTSNIPWMWIILGVVLVILILLFLGRSKD